MYVTLVASELCPGMNLVAQILLIITYFPTVVSLKCVLVLWFSCCFELNDILVDGGTLIQ